SQRSLSLAITQDHFEYWDTNVAPTLIEPVAVAPPKSAVPSTKPVVSKLPLVSNATPVPQLDPPLPFLAQRQAGGKPPDTVKHATTYVGLPHAGSKLSPRLIVEVVSTVS